MDLSELVSGEAPVADLRGLSLSPGGAEKLLLGGGWLVIRLDGAAISSKDSLFSAFAAALGREYFAANWDAFEDSLKSLPYDEPASAGFAVILENYGMSLTGEPGWTGFFTDSVRDADSSIRSGHGRRLKVFLF